MKKKVSFGGKRPSDTTPPGADDWVVHRGTPAREVNKRLTVDVPLSLHKRIKSQCAIEDLVMADVIRDLLEQRFPRQS